MSEAEEMYLVATAMLIEDGVRGPVPLPALAQARSILPASVNQMVRKLADAGYIHYVPYRGVELTQTGADIAASILRSRRLWEVFLVEKLQMSPKEADALACRLEHLTNEDVADRLSEYLGHPTTCPQGKPIVDRRTAAAAKQELLPLTTLAVGESSIVQHVDTDGVSLSFMANQGIVPGAQVTLLAQGSDRLLLQCADRTIELVAPLASRVLLA